jgi:uncharacterized protein (TIRG00374 family)
VTRGGQRGKLLLGLLLAAALLVVFFRGVDWSALLTALRRADPILLLGVVATTVLVYVLRSWRWGYLLAPLGRVPFKHLLSATYVGFMSGLLVPRAGEVVRPYLVGRRHSIPASAAFATIVLERLVDLMTVLALFSLYLYVLPPPAAQLRGSFMAGLGRGGAIAALIAVGVLAVLLAFQLQARRALAVVGWVLGWLPQRLAAPIGEAVRAFVDGLAVLRAPFSHLLVLAGQSVLVWLAIAAGLYLNNSAFGLGLPFHTTFLILGLLTVGVAVPTPGMVGGFHVAYQIALTRAYGVDRDVAAAAGLASHALTNLPVLVLGLYYLGREGLTMGRVAEITEAPPPVAEPLPAGEAT